MSNTVISKQTKLENAQDSILITVEPDKPQPSLEGIFDWMFEKPAAKTRLTTNCPAYPVTPSTFGPDFDQQIDGKRLQTQLVVVAAFMLEMRRQGRWVALHEIEEATGYSSASISAQLRHLRKKKFGGHNVEKRRRVHASGSVGGTWEYLVIPNPIGGVIE
jgi:hypothetical protein